MLFGYCLKCYIAVEVPGENCSNEWLKPVSDEQYVSLGK